MSTKKRLIVGNYPDINSEISSLVQTNFKNKINIVATANCVKAALTEL